MSISSTELSLLLPVFNEEDVLEPFISKVSAILTDRDITFELIFINDGSTDNTLQILKEQLELNKSIKIINLSRNFGKEQALSAGLDFASGQAAIPIDCDFQDPPELIIDMYEKWKEGFDVVLAKRIDRSSDTSMKRWSSSLFYSIIEKISDVVIPKNVGDFRLIDRKVIDVLKNYPERTRFMKGIFASVGFRQTTVEYIRPERAAGNTSWNYFSLYKLALEGIVSFTSLPLKVWSYLGSLISIFSFMYGFYLIIKTIIFGVDMPGYASLMVVILFMSGLVLLSLGVIGEYLSRIFIEIKQRPIYIVMDKFGFDE
ncbi:MULTISPECIES: glycosyltransferase family 2 protein [unclassified Methylophaga]|jgi:glycosyltransferase involved in cell wall biosynthesis|uniref:glycosyltransferase family 2 protein n=1 Tax=unclassified Methylophaga TaxID=2629249 RepID=UPI00259C7624|nr:MULTISPECIES: glycosyltransferase family 2 protein [unclassified Methylophaga]|tara:strand:+ start:2240 stop:3184 length:945 start_codon:yes stop_codon:yes gene_type:complete